MTKWQFLFRRLSNTLLFRASLYALAGLGAAVLAWAAKFVIPDTGWVTVGASAVGDILNILASSMLAVATFSLSTMVSAFSSASSGATPRATQLVMDDSTAQNALSTFIGAFLFSLVGIIQLRMGLYGPSGRIVLFVFTLGVIALVVVTLIRWIDSLTNLGRLGETITRVKRAAITALEQERDTPILGATAVASRNTRTFRHPVILPGIGYVQHVDAEMLHAVAERLGADLFIAAMPGKLVDGVQPAAWSTVELPHQASAELAEAWTVADARTFEQDPRFGLIVLSEIASRALSPAVNDPGTAITIIGAGLQAFAAWLHPTEEKPAVRFPHLHATPIGVDELLSDIFTPIARDGAGLVEVQIRLQKALRSIAGLGGTRTQAACRAAAADAMARAMATLTSAADKKQLRAAAFK